MQADDSSNDLLTFLQSAGSVILGLLGSQQQYRAAPNFEAASKSSPQGLFQLVAI